MKKIIFYLGLMLIVNITYTFAQLGCHVNALCTTGVYNSSWCNQIRSVVKFNYSVYDSDELDEHDKAIKVAEWFCIGVLINNNHNPKKAYILTAGHCSTPLKKVGEAYIQKPSFFIDWANAEFEFNKQSATCTNIPPINNVTLKGAFKHESEFVYGGCTDIGLIELIEPIPYQYAVYYSGWYFVPSDESLTITYTTIHHPAGIEK